MAGVIVQKLVFVLETNTEGQSAQDVLRGGEAGPVEGGHEWAPFRQDFGG